MTEERKKERRVGLAGWLREGLIKLGPTFIKIGQQFSTRVDVLSREFIAELEKVLGPLTCPGPRDAPALHACTGDEAEGAGIGGARRVRFESALVTCLLAFSVAVSALS